MNIVICHDGLDDRYSREYGLSFLERGQSVNFYSHYTCTGASWTSIYTGLQREKHGVPRTWQKWLQMEKKPLLRKLPCLWFDLNRKGKTVGLFDLAMTHPPPAVKNWAVSGFPSPQLLEERVHPKHLIEHLPHRLMKLDSLASEHLYKSHKALPSSYTDPKPWRLRFTKFARNHIDEKLSYIKALSELYPVDVLFIGFDFVDAMHHYNARYEDIYRYAEYSVERIYEEFNAEKTIIISDHGTEKDSKVSHSHDAVFFVDGDKVKDPERERREWQVKKDLLNILLGGT